MRRIDSRSHRNAALVGLLADFGNKSRHVPVDWLRLIDDYRQPANPAPSRHRRARHGRP